MFGNRKITLADPYLTSHFVRYQEMFSSIMRRYGAKSRLNKRCAFAATNFVPWDIDLEVLGPAEVVRVRAVGEFTAVWRASGTNEGRVSTKLHKTAAAARKHAQSALDDAHKKTGAAISAPTVAVSDPTFRKDMNDMKPKPRWPSWWLGKNA